MLRVVSRVLEVNSAGTGLPGLDSRQCDGGFILRSAGRQILAVLRNIVGSFAS